ncbi:MAG: hypothetical protein JJE25_07185, partial [Bacteroidia bacterium]|nr:hypothetical protein [Bacteroidia bacterium]
SAEETYKRKHNGHGASVLSEVYGTLPNLDVKKREDEIKEMRGEWERNI